MSKHEKLGNYLLFEKHDEDKVSRNFLAGQIINHKIQKFHQIKKYDSSVASSPEFVTGLIQSQELLKQLANPTLLIPTEVVHEKSQLGSVLDDLEGQNLKAILERCARDGYPFSADHALLIGSRICAALEFLHTKKVDNRRLIHGYVSPENVYVTYDGEVKLLYLDLAHHLMKIPAGRDKLLQFYSEYLAPELAGKHEMERSADTYSAGVLMFRLLSGESYRAEGQEASPARLEQITMTNQSGDRLPVPDEVKAILTKALNQDPAQRYGNIADMRKAIDQYLFAGDFAPTTFNLAFFMNSLFRGAVEEEEKKRAEWKKLDVAALVKEEPPASVKPPVGAEKAKDLPVGTMGAPSAPVSGPQEMFGLEPPKEKSKAPLFIGLLVIIAAIATIAFIFLKPSSDTSQASAPQLTPQQIAERKQLEMEAQKAQEVAKAKDQELQDLKAQMEEILKAQAKSKAPDPAVQQMQQKLAQLELEKKQQEALAQEKLKAVQAQTPAPAPTPPPQTADATPSPTGTSQQPAGESPSPTPESGSPTEIKPQPQAEPAKTPSQQQAQPQQPAATNTPPPQVTTGVKEGDLVELTADVTKPNLVKRINPTYPAAAMARRAEGTVILSLLVSEKGDVTDAKVLRGVSGPGLDQAALDAVKKWKFTPAMKNGKRVRVWITYPIVFKMQ